MLSSRTNNPCIQGSNTTGYVNSKPVIQKHTPKTTNNSTQENLSYDNQFGSSLGTQNLNNSFNIKTQAYTSYINVDSSQRTKDCIDIYDDVLYSLPPFALKFTNGSSLVTINLPDHPFKINDRIILNNVVSKNIILQNVIMVKKNSFFVRVFHQNHGLSFFGLYNPNNYEDFIKIDYVDQLPVAYSESDNIPDGMHQYYIFKNNSRMDFDVQFSNIKGCNQGRNFIGNIPINYLNRRQTVYLLFVKNNGSFIYDPNSYLIRLEKKSSINYMDGVNELFSGGTCTNTIYIKYHNLFGIPLCYLNMVSKNKYSYLTIVETSKNTFTIDTKYPAIVDPNTNFYHYSDLQNHDMDQNQFIGPNNGGGDKIIARKISSTIQGYPDPNNYAYQLNRIYKNIIQIRLVGSIFPNSQKIINDNPDDVINNKLYWRNLIDGDHIYQLSIFPGNYDTEELRKAIENNFNKTLRYQYSQEFDAGIQQSIIESSTPNDTNLYDENGYYKYHIVKVNISEETDEVAFYSYRKIIQSNTIENNILSIPDHFVEFTITDFVPGPQELLFIYFTPNSHPQINDIFPYTYYNLYRYIEIMDVGNNTILVELEKDIAILVNFNIIKKNGSVAESFNEINSINTTTVFENFTYNHLTMEIFKYDHNLKKGDLLITDQFIDPQTIGSIFVYEITTVINNDKFVVKKYNHGEKYKFIYENIIINTESRCPYQYLGENIFIMNVNPRPENKLLLVVKHPNHGLSEGDIISISNAPSINQVPESLINSDHTINSVIDDNYYAIKFKNYIPIFTDKIPKPSIITIKYPDLFQMFFNYNDTLGEKLSFRDIGCESSITPYKHKIKNTDPYINECVNKIYPPKKLNLTGDNYFYLVSPELASIDNTKPVQNVFSIIRWSENPGNIVFDSYVPTIKIFNPPLPFLNKLHFSLVHPNGKFVNFNGLDHSFVLEIIELHNQPSGTDISSHLNSEILVRKI